MCCLCAPTHRASNGNLHQAIYQIQRTRQNAFESSAVVPSLNGHIFNSVHLDQVSIFTSGSLQPFRYEEEKVFKFRNEPCPLSNIPNKSSEV